VVIKMKLQQIKQAVFEALRLKTTQELKKIRPDLVKGLDLRTKTAWQQIEKALTEEADRQFQTTLLEAQKANMESNSIVADSLKQWDAFKAKVLAESEAEESAKLVHLSDYRSPKQSKKSTKKADVIKFRT